MPQPYLVAEDDGDGPGVGSEGDHHALLVLFGEDEPPCDPVLGGIHQDHLAAIRAHGQGRDVGAPGQADHGAVAFAGHVHHRVRSFVVDAADPQRAVSAAADQHPAVRPPAQRVHGSRVTGQYPPQPPVRIVGEGFRRDEPAAQDLARVMQSSPDLLPCQTTAVQGDGEIEAPHVTCQEMSLSVDQRAEFHGEAVHSQDREHREVARRFRLQGGRTAAPDPFDEKPEVGGGVVEVGGGEGSREVVGDVVQERGIGARCGQGVPARPAAQRGLPLQQGLMCLPDRFRVATAQDVTDDVVQPYALSVVLGQQGVLIQAHALAARGQFGHSPEPREPAVGDVLVLREAGHGRQPPQ